MTGIHRPDEQKAAGRIMALLRRKTGRLAGDTVWATSIEVLGLVSSIVIMYLITTRLGAGEYGYFVGVQALVATLGMLSYASVSQVLMQSIVRDREHPAAAFARSLGLLTVATALTLALGIGLRPILFPQLPVAVFALFAMAELAGSGTVAVAASFLQALDAYRESVTIRLALLVLRSLTVLLLALLGILSLASLAWCYFLLGLGAAGTVLVRLRQRPNLSLRIARPTGREVRDSLSFAVALLSFSVHEDADKILMVRLADPVAAGMYAAAYRAVQVAVSPLRALVAASHRRFLEHDPDRAGQHLERALLYTRFSAAYGAVAALAVFLAAPLIPELLGHSYAGSVTMVRWLAALAMLRGIGVFAFNGLMGLRCHGQRLLAVGTGAMVAAVVSGLLIPVWSWRGAAVGTLVAESVFLTLCWVTLVRQQRRHDATVRSRSTGADADRALIGT